MARTIQFNELIRSLRKKKSKLPRLLGNISKNHFVKSFRDEGFTDGSLNKWKSRKRRDKNKKRRGLLVDSGNLRRSIRVKSARFSRIRIGSYGIPYAQRHNRGLDGMPQRQFIGRSIKLRKKLSKRISKEIKKVFK